MRLKQRVMIQEKNDLCRKGNLKGVFYLNPTESLATQA